MTKQCANTYDFDDITLWPDSFWCYRYEMHKFPNRGNDFKFIHFGTPEYYQFMKEVEDEASDD